MKPELKQKLESMLGPEFMGPVKLKPAHAREQYERDMALFNCAAIDADGNPVPVDQLHAGPAPAPVLLPGNAPATSVLLENVLTQLRQGDTLVLGELPRALQHGSSRAIANFRKEALPLIVDMGPDLEAIAKAMITESYGRARQHELDVALSAASSSPGGIVNSIDDIVHYLPLYAMRIDLLPRLDLLSGPPSRLGQHKGENRVPKRVANDPVRCAAKGMKTFIIEGEEVLAGTEKAAWKEWRKMKAQGH